MEMEPYGRFPIKEANGIPWKLIEAYDNIKGIQLDQPTNNRQC